MAPVLAADYCFWGWPKGHSGTCNDYIERQPLLKLNAPTLSQYPVPLEKRLEEDIMLQDKKKITISFSQNLFPDFQMRGLLIY